MEAKQNKKRQIRKKRNVRKLKLKNKIFKLKNKVFKILKNKKLNKRSTMLKNKKLKNNRRKTFVEKTFVENTNHINDNYQILKKMIEAETLDEKTILKIKNDAREQTERYIPEVIKQWKALNEKPEENKERIDRFKSVMENSIIEWDNFYTEAQKFYDVIKYKGLTDGQNIVVLQKALEIFTPRLEFEKYLQSFLKQDLKCIDDEKIQEIENKLKEYYFKIVENKIKFIPSEELDNLPNIDDIYSDNAINKIIESTNKIKNEKEKLIKMNFTL